MSQTMIERIARAIAPEAWEPGRYFGSAVRRWRREMSIRNARAALAALREPTEGMVTMGESAAEMPDDEDGCRITFAADDVFRAMIDAALEGK